MVRLVALAALAACQGSGSSPPATGSGSGSARDAAAVLADAAASEPDARGKPDEPDVPDPGKVLAGLGAIPAWQGVVDRAQLLARRGQHGVVYGRIGPAILQPVEAGAPLDAGTMPSPYVWLVDDTEGNGALGIRVALADAHATLGDRVALGGAWDLDAAHAWFWKVDALTALAPAPASDLKEAPVAVPSHAIASGDLVPGSRTISVSRDGDAVYFQIVGPAPATDGDGWQVADELGNPTFAIMNLPGERPSYGGLDMRAPDERWTLRRGQTYCLRIGKLRKHGDKPTTVNARTAPLRVK